jgi:hypothetical protein
MEDVHAQDDLDRPAVYRIQVRGRLDEQWSGWFGGMAIAHQGGGDGPSMTVLTGTVADQAALLGILAKIAYMNLTLISVNRVEGSIKDE